MVGHCIDSAGRLHAVKEATFESVLMAMSENDTPLERRRGERRTAERRTADGSQLDRRCRGRRMSDLLAV